MTSLTLDRNTRKHLIAHRRDLKDALDANDSEATEIALRKLLQVESSLKHKCQTISVATILNTNCRNPSNWDQVSKALGILERYATNLLKPEDQRPKGWEAIMTKNDIFIKRINPIVGAREILSIIGYRGREEDALKLVGEPNTDKLQALRVDLKIAKCEMDLYQNKSHPFPHRLDELVQEEARIAQDPSKQSMVIKSLPLPASGSSGSLSSLPSPTSTSYQGSQITSPGAMTSQNSMTSSGSHGAVTPPCTSAGTTTTVSSTTSTPTTPSLRATPPKVLPKPVRANQDRNQNQAIQDRNQSYNNQKNQANFNQMNQFGSQSPGGQFGNQSLPYAPAHGSTYPSPPRGRGAPYQSPHAASPGFQGPPHAPPYQGPSREAVQGTPMGATYRNQPPPYYQCQTPYINSPGGRVATYGPPGPPQQAWSPADTASLPPPHAPRRPAPPVPDKPVIDLHARGAGGEKRLPDSQGVRPQASAPPLYPSLPTSVEELPRGDWCHFREPEKSSTDSFGLPGRDTAAQGRDEGRESEKDEKPGFFAKWYNKWFGSSSAEEGEEMHESRDQPRDQSRDQARDQPRGRVWPGTQIQIPSIATDLLREKDPVRRFQNLESIITALDLEAQKFDDQIELILATDHEFRKNKNYVKLTQQRDDLKRELILLKRVRQDVQRAGVEGGSAEVGQRLARGDQTFPRNQPRPALPGSHPEGYQTLPGTQGPGENLPGTQRPRSVELQTRDYESIRQEDQVRRLSDTTGVWACQYCTSHNPMTLNICQICSKTADLKVKVDEPEVKVTESEVKVEEQEDGFHTPREDSEEFMVIETDWVGTREWDCCIRQSVTAVGSGDGGAQISPSQGAPAGPLGAPLDGAEPPEGAQAPAPVDMDQILDWMMLCEDRGYTVQQFQVALRAITNNNSRLSPLDWLATNWPLMIALVEADLPESSELGKFSQREIETALGESETSRINVIVDQCRNTRRSLVESLVGTYTSLPRERILATLTQYHGSERDTCRELNKLVMRPLLAELETSQERRLEDQELQEIIANAQFTREACLIMLMSERSITEGVATDVLSIIGEGGTGQDGGTGLLDPDDTTPDLTLTEIIDTAKSCNSVGQTIDNLQRKCPICDLLYPESRMRSMYVCDCRMCVECLLRYFRYRVREEPASRFNCPLCGLPDMQRKEPTYFHFQMLDNLLKETLDRDDYERYQKKVLDWQCLDQNFRYCQSDKCQQGFVVDAELIRARLCITCPHCGESACHKCKRKWAAAHDGIECHEFAKWLEDNNPDTNQQAMDRMLQEDGIQCPNCPARYLLSRGGCQHFTCRQCQHQFCSGCYQPMNKTCRRFAACVGRGFHAHHPRNCYTNLRDYSCETLIELLENSGHPVREAVIQGADRCEIPEQKEIKGRNGNLEMRDEPCGRELYDNTRRCEIHYKEYLVMRLRQYRIDPVVIMEEGSLRGHLQENEIVIPANYETMTGPQREQSLRQLVRSELPLVH